MLSHLHVVVDLEGVVEVEEVLHLVIRDAAVDHRLLARVHDDERQLKCNLSKTIDEVSYVKA